MLHRIAASLLSLALVAGISPAAGARTFSQPPPAAAAPTAQLAPDGARPVPPPPIDRAAVIAALAARRAHNLAAFRAYRKRGVYPHNVVRPGPLNVWLDPDGHLCAAATMIDRDGQHDLVQQTAASNNNLRLLDVTEGPLLDWMLTSGFTLEEIDRIQAPMIAPDAPERDPQWRLAEDARLRREYAATDAWLVKHRKAGLATAADRLMEHPALARALVDGAMS